MHIYIARHAWAYEQGDPRWPDDSLRELEPEGVERYIQVVQALAERGFAPELIATSPFTRCVQTATLISQHTAHQPVVIKTAALAPHSDIETLLVRARQAKRDSVCWVGHAPDVSLLAAELVGDGCANLRFAKGSIASVRMCGAIGVGQGELMWLATAKVLGV